MARNMQIPSGWRLVRLEDVAETIMGQSPPGDTVFDWNGDGRSNDGLPFIQGNAEFGIKFPSPLKWCARPAKVAVPGDILISVRAPVGQTNRADRQLGIGRGLAAIRFDASTKTFGWHVINHVKGTLERVTQGSTFRAIGGKDLRNLRIPFPPLSEQRAIAAVLDSIDEAIEHTEAVITATERLRESLLHELLTHGVPGWHTKWKEVRGIGTIPADWKVARLGDVAEIRGGVGFPLQRQGRDDGEFPFIKVSDMTLEGNETYIHRANNYVDQQDVKELRANVFTPGTIVFPKVGAAIATNKKRALTVPTIIDNNMVGVSISNTEQCDGRFLHNWFKSIDLTQLANVSAVPSITGSRLKRQSIPLPSILEQRTIATVLDEVDYATDRTRKERDGLHSLKTSVADALLTGRLRVAV